MIAQFNFLLFILEKTRTRSHVVSAKSSRVKRHFNLHLLTFFCPPHLAQNKRDSSERLKGAQVNNSP